MFDGSDGKESACSVGDRFNPWLRKIPWRRAWQPTPVLLPGESHGQESLAGYIHRVALSWTRLKQLSMHARSLLLFFSSKSVTIFIIALVSFQFPASDSLNLPILMFASFIVGISWRAKVLPLGGSFPPPPLKAVHT